MVVIGRAWRPRETWLIISAARAWNEQDAVGRTRAITSHSSTDPRARFANRSLRNHSHLDVDHAATGSTPTPIRLPGRCDDAPKPVAYSEWFKTWIDRRTAHIVLTANVSDEGKHMSRTH